MLTRLKHFFGAQDMTVGKPMTNIAKFAIPLLIGNLAQQLYSTVDSIVVGRYCTVAINGYTGDIALGAIGVSTSIVFLMTVLFIAIGTGTSILVAQLFGARDGERLKKCIGSAVTMTFVASLGMTLIGVTLSGPLLRLINVADVYYELAKVYLQICFIGMIGNGFYNIISGILRGLGDSFYPLVFLVVAALLNIVLDLWFVIGFGWGVAGVAWATIISQAVSALLCMIRLMNMKDIIVISRQSLKPDMRMVKDVLRLGLPSGVTQAVFSTAMLIVTSLTNQMGVIVPTVSMTVMRVDGFAMLPNFTFGLAISTYIGQNIGANKQERVKPGEKAVLKLALICSFILVFCIVVWGKNLIGVFLGQENVDPNTYDMIVDLGGDALRILAVGYIAMAIMQIYSGILRAAGDTIAPMVISIVTTVILRVPIAYAMAYFTRSDEWVNGHPYSLFVSMLVSWVMSAVLTYMRYRKGKWKNIKLVEQQPIL